MFGELNKNIKKLLVKSGHIKDTESVFCYLQQSVSPPPSATIGDLITNFGIDAKTMMVKYAIVEAWG